MLNVLHTSRAETKALLYVHGSHAARRPVDNEAVHYLETLTRHDCKKHPPPSPPPPGVGHDYDPPKMTKYCLGLCSGDITEWYTVQPTGGRSVAASLRSTISLPLSTFGVANARSWLVASTILVKSSVTGETLHIDAWSICPSGSDIHLTEIPYTPPCAPRRSVSALSRRGRCPHIPLEDSVVTPCFLAIVMVSMARTRAKKFGI